MKKLKRNKYQPWLTATGVERPLADLREIVKSWNPATWESYLNWYVTGRREALVTPGIYAMICEKQTESIFEQFDQDGSLEKRTKCERLLELLPELEAIVLRLHFMEGRTEAEIGFQLKRSQTGISLIKNRALSRLKRGNPGDEMLARRFMKGETFFPEQEPRLWDTPLQNPIKESRFYDPKNHLAEFAKIETPSVRVALQALSELEQKILYMRFWCGKSLNHTARAVNCGVNNVQEIETASVSKVKRNALAFEIENIPGGESCA